MKRSVELYLDSLVRTEIEVELGRMSDSDIDSCSSWNVSRLSGLLFFIRAKESGVVAFLNYDEGDAGFIIGLELDACLANCRQLML